MVLYIKIAFSVFFAAMCLLVVGWWVRSYWWRDRFEGKSLHAGLINAWSLEGQLTILYAGKPGHWRVTTTAHPQLHTPLKALFAFGLFSNDAGVTVYVPHWSLAVVMCAIAAMPWISWKFSLRTLLILTTVIAMVLGLIYALNFQYGRLD
jgi:hypothetical protein